MSARAKVLKEDGNNAFRKGLYDDAVLLYTEACQLDPSEYTYPLNRCMTYLKLGKLREAERDATKSLQLLPAGNPKALFRRGLARKGLGKLDLARQDFLAALKEEPSNTAVKAELDTLPKANERPSTASSKTDTKPSTSIGRTTPVKPNLPAKSVNTVQDRTSALKAAIKPEHNENTDGGLMSAVSTRRLKQPDASASAIAKEVEVVSPSQAAPSSTNKDFRSLRATRDQRLASISSKPLEKASTSQGTSKASSLTPMLDKADASLSSLKETSAPKNMYDFETRWTNEKDLDSRAGMIIALLNQYSSLEAFFGSSLTPELLDDMLACLDTACRQYLEIRSQAVDFLHILPKCARFDFLSMLCANTAMVKSIVEGDPGASEIIAAWGAS